MAKLGLTDGQTTAQNDERRTNRWPNRHGTQFSSYGARFFREEGKQNFYQMRVAANDGKELLFLQVLDMNRQPLRRHL
jgi:hypothetical protein